MLQGEIPAQANLAAAGHARGRLIVNLAPVIALPPHLLRRADPLIVNEHEGAAALDQLGGIGQQGPAEVVSALMTRGVASVVMTLGAAGALVGQGGDLVSVASPKVSAVDTFGAGDAFVGALAARLATSGDLLAAARHAVRFAAYSVQFDGAQTSYPVPGTGLPETS